MEIEKFLSAYPVSLCVVYMVSRLVSAFRGQRTLIPIAPISKKRRIASSYISSLHTIFCLCLVRLEQSLIRPSADTHSRLRQPSSPVTFLPMAWILRGGLLPTTWWGFQSSYFSWNVYLHLTCLFLGVSAWSWSFLRCWLAS